MRSTIRGNRFSSIMMCGTLQSSGRNHLIVDSASLLLQLRRGMLQTHQGISCFQNQASIDILPCALHDRRFLVRDCFLWIYTQNQAKAMSLNHFIDKLDTDKITKEKIKKKLQGWKTPQIKSCFEPIAVAQKPPEDTFLSNALKHEVGLFNTNVRVGRNMFPSNILMVDSVDYFMDRYFLIPKPTKQEKGDFNGHQTVKPLTICEHLIKLSTLSKNGVVLDPFLGSGTTAVAAKNLGRNFIGVDINPEYVDIAKKRLRHKHNTNLKLSI